MTSKYYVYLLISNNINFLKYSYVGITTDLNRRLAQHNGLLSGGAKSTRGKGPFEILYYIEANDRSEASKYEYEIKQEKGFQKRLDKMGEIQKRNI